MQFTYVSNATDRVKLLCVLGSEAKELQTSRQDKNLIESSVCEIDSTGKSGLEKLPSGRGGPKNDKNQGSMVRDDQLMT